MLPLNAAIKRNGIRTARNALGRVPQRNASLTSSIERGVRKAANALKAAEKRRVREGNLAFWETRDKDKVAQAEEYARNRQTRDAEQDDRLNFLRSGAPSETQPIDGQHEPAQRNFRDAKARNTAVRKGMLVDAPAAVPYTKPNSEFLFGTFAVMAALKSKRRKMHNLYLWCGEDGSLLDSDKDTTEILRMARANKVPLLRVAGSWEKMLDRMSNRRPHNGLVLEASPLPQLPTKILHTMTTKDDGLRISLNSMDVSEKADFNIAQDATTYEIPHNDSEKRFPFLLWLDKITDTGNMGAIFRSAYFFGVDAIIVPQHGTAPLNAIVIKTSAGAAEHIPILKIENELDFIKRSKGNGWKFFAAAASTSKSTLKRNNDGSVPQDSFESLKSHPCVLMLGNEGSGLRTFLQKEADGSVAIESPHGAGKLIDSLNVSVAAALLTQRFLAG